MAEQYRTDLATGSICLLVGAVGLFELAGQPTARNMGVDLGPTVLPTYLLYALVALGLLLMLRVAFSARLPDSSAPEETKLSPEGALPSIPLAKYLPLFFLVLLATCVYAISRWTFEVPVALFTFICGLAIHRLKTGSLHWRAVALRAIEAVVIMAALSLLFRTVLRVPLP